VGAKEEFEVSVGASFGTHDSDPKEFAKEPLAELGMETYEVYVHPTIVSLRFRRFEHLQKFAKTIGFSLRRRQEKPEDALETRDC